MFLILGLGNPGSRYELTRHNLGFLVADNLAEKHGIDISQKGYASLYGFGEIEGQRVMIAKPHTYMNRSGRTAKAISSELEIPTEQIVVVHDDVDIALGKLKVKHQGGDAGQRGVRSIVQSLQTDKFSRVRAGIGRPDSSMDIDEYVLSVFEKEETERLNDVIEQAMRMVETIIVEFDKRKNLTEE